MNCKGAHKANDKICPVRQYNLNIKEVIRKKISRDTKLKNHFQYKVKQYNKETDRFRTQKIYNRQDKEQDRGKRKTHDFSWSEVVSRREEGSNRYETDT